MKKVETGEEAARRYEHKSGPFSSVVTLRRWGVTIRDRAFQALCKRIVIETLPEQLLLVLRTGKVSTNVYLRRLQNHCLGMGWLALPVLPRKLFTEKGGP